MTNPLDAIFSDELKVPEGDRRILNWIADDIQTSQCKGCALHDHRASAKPVPGDGIGRVMFVGHTVGRNEATTGIPMTGQASRYGLSFFTDILPVDSSRIRTNDARDYLADYIYMTNAARCGHQQDAKASAAHWRRCADTAGPNWLAKEVDIVDPVIVVFLNSTMCKTILGKEAPARGEIKKARLYGETRNVMLMGHPVSVAWDSSEEGIIKGDYETLAHWLYEQGYLLETPDVQKYPKATHHLVTTEAGLSDMLDDLWHKEQIALDTETFFKGDLEWLQALEDGGHEGEKGALLWYYKQFEAVCYQVAGLSSSGIVEDTWTVSMRFRDRMTGQPFQDITPAQALDSLDQLLRADEFNGYPRTVFMWNALFDCPVLTREGIDLWGMTHQDYNAEILDAMIYFGRMNEHQGSKKGRSTLDAASQLYLKERKGSFTDRFDVKTFAYEDITNEQTRQEVLEYCGEDPRKTLLCGVEIIEDWKEHIDKRRYALESAPSSFPVMGIGPFQRPGEEVYGNRTMDVGLPLDHQMIPIIGEMEMLGFQFEMDDIEDRRETAHTVKEDLLRGIHDFRPGFNPNSSHDALSVVTDVFKAIAYFLEDVIEETASEPNATAIRRECMRIFNLNPHTIKGSPSASDVKRAYKKVYGTIDAQKDTIQDRFLIYLLVVEGLIQDVCDEHSIETEIPELLDVTALETFFKRVFYWKQIDKKWGTYFERFIKLRDRHDIIHPYYLLISTLSGRYSGNFQNVPRGGPEDVQFIADVLEVLPDTEVPEDKEEKEELIKQYNKFDVRQVCRAVQPSDLNRIFETMNLETPDGTPWRVSENEEYVIAIADFAGQEDRMAFAESGDETKARLLSNPELDTHFYNVAFCFGAMDEFDTSTKAGVDRAYQYYTKQDQIKRLQAEISHVSSNEVDGMYHGYGTPLEVETYVDNLHEELYRLEKIKKENKRKYRTPMKTVHYASQYGAGAKKLHTVLKPIFLRLGIQWTFEDTEKLKERYDELYAGVVEKTKEIIDSLSHKPFLEYPIFGILRHASLNHRGEVEDALSVANAYNQGTCAYMTKASMLRVRHGIYDNAERWDLVQVGGDRYVGILIQVHDEIGILCPKSLAHEVAKLLEAAMKTSVRPIEGEDARGYASYYDTEFKDARGDTGYLCIPDEKIIGPTFFDADAEIKRTVAKATTLATGEENLIALMDEPHTMKKLDNEAIRGVNEEYPLILPKKGFAPVDEDGQEIVC